MSRHIATLIVLFGFAAAEMSHAQGDTTYAAEYIKRVDAAKNLTPLGGDLFVVLFCEDGADEGG